MESTKGRAVVTAFLVLSVVTAMALAPPPTAAQTELPALPDAEAPALPVPVPWTGDFDKMKERRLVRILVPFSKTIYFLDTDRLHSRLARPAPERSR
jgi:hypothetical protein